MKSWQGTRPQHWRALPACTRTGAEPRAVLEDLLGLTHWVSRILVAPEAADEPEVPENERERGRDLAAKLSVPVLARAWQMILRALEEANAAPDARAAVEMAVIRLCFVADLPDPGSLVRRLQQSGPGADQLPAAQPRAVPASAGSGAAAVAAAPAAAAAPSPGKRPQARAAPATFEALIEGLRDGRHVQLVYGLENYVHLVRFDPQQRLLEYRVSERAPPDFVGKLAMSLERATGDRWMLSLVPEGGEATVRERRVKETERRIRVASANDIVTTARRRVRNLPDGMRVSEPEVIQVRERMMTDKHQS